MFCLDYSGYRPMALPLYMADISERLYTSVSIVILCNKKTNKFPQLSGQSTGFHFEGGNQDVSSKTFFEPDLRQSSDME